MTKLLYSLAAEIERRKAFLTRLQTPGENGYADRARVMWVGDDGAMRVSASPEVHTMLDNMGIDWIIP